MIEQDLDGQVNIQSLPIEIDTEVSHQKYDNVTEQWKLASNSNLLHFLSLQPTGKTFDVSNVNYKF